MTGTTPIDCILRGDCIEMLRAFPDESIDCCVTSPPYFGLRDYGVDGQIGLEPSPEEYVWKLVTVFREVRRVLKKEGTLWLNLGDSYSAAKTGSFNGGGFKDNSAKNGTRDLSGVETSGKFDKAEACAKNGIKPKDLIGIPWRVAFALQADGWYLRSDIIWAKGNPMPESVTDRPTKSHEYVFLLAKSKKYYYDAEAVKEPTTGNAHKRGRGVHPKSAEPGKGIKANSSFEAACTEIVTSRNKRSVWIINSSPFKEAHFAVMPEALVEPCVMAGTSEKGVCPGCGKAWVRQTSKRRATYHKTEDPTLLTGRAGMNRERFGKSDSYVLAISQPELSEMLRKAAKGKEAEMEGHFGSKWQHWIRTDSSGARIPTFSDAKEIHAVLGVEIPFDGASGGWLPSCSCNLPPQPAVVLDPFFGAGTVGAVAKRLGRHFVGIELNPAYIQIATQRLGEIPTRLDRWAEVRRI